MQFIIPQKLSSILLTRASSISIILSLIKIYLYKLVVLFNPKMNNRSKRFSKFARIDIKGLLFLI